MLCKRTKNGICFIVSEKKK